MRYPGGVAGSTSPSTRPPVRHASRCATTAQASPPRCVRTCSSRGSPPSRVGGGSAWRWRAASSSSNTPGGCCTVRLRAGRGPSSCWSFRWCKSGMGDGEGGTGDAAAQSDSRGCGPPPGWTVTGPRRSRLGQDPRVDGPHRPPDPGARRGSLADLRGHVHQQGGGRDAGPGGGVARCRSARSVDRDVPLALGAAAAARGGPPRLRVQLHDLRPGRFRGAGQTVARAARPFAQSQSPARDPRHHFRGEEPHAPPRGAGRERREPAGARGGGDLRVARPRPEAGQRDGFRRPPAPSPHALRRACRAARLLATALRPRAGGRVPGHQRGAVSTGAPAGGAAHQSLRGRRRRPGDLRLARRAAADDVPDDGMAVLYRTNAQSRPLEEAFRFRGIPYRLVGAVSFYERREVKDVLAYLRLIANPADDQAFLRAVNVPRRGIGDASLAQLVRAATQWKQSLFETARAAGRIPDLRPNVRDAFAGVARLLEDLRARYAQADPATALEQTIAAVAYPQYLAEEGPEGIERLENVQELIAGAAQWAETAEEDDGTGDGAEETGATSLIERYPTQAALVTSADQGQGDPTGVTLMTVHMAKGLEWPVVTLGGLEDGLFPLARAGGPGLGCRGLAGCPSLHRGRAGAPPQVRERSGARRLGRRSGSEGHGGVRRSGDRHQAPAGRLRRARARVGECMSVTHDEVLKISRLAELDVSEEALPLLAEQMSRILDYVAQINAVPASEGVRALVPGPDALRFRADEVRPIILAFGPETLAPAFKDGFFLVPKLGAFEVVDS